jgi:hypothetical protein
VLRIRLEAACGVRLVLVWHLDHVSPAMTKLASRRSLLTIQVSVIATATEFLMRQRRAMAATMALEPVSKFARPARQITLHRLVHPHAAINLALSCRPWRFALQSHHGAWMAIVDGEAVWLLSAPPNRLTTVILVVTRAHLLSSMWSRRLVNAHQR